MFRFGKFKAALVPISFVQINGFIKIRLINDLNNPCSWYPGVEWLIEDCKVEDLGDSVSLEGRVHKWSYMRETKFIAGDEAFEKLSEKFTYKKSKVEIQKNTNGFLGWFWNIFAESFSFILTPAKSFTLFRISAGWVKHNKEFTGIKYVVPKNAIIWIDKEEENEE